MLILLYAVVDKINFEPVSSGFQSASSFVNAGDLLLGAGPSGFAPAEQLSTQESPILPSSSLDGPQDRDLSSWFESADIPRGGLTFQSAKDLAIIPPDDDFSRHDESDEWLTATPPEGALIGFQSAKNLPPEPANDDDVELTSPQAAPSALLGFAPASTMHQSDSQRYSNVDSMHADKREVTLPFAGFRSGSTLLNSGKGTKISSWSAPSAEALAKAEERMKRWQAEIDADFHESTTEENEESVPPPDLSTEKPAVARVILGAVENSTTPSPSPPLPQPDAPATPTSIRVGFKTSSAATGGPFASRKPFKSPLLRKPAVPSYIASPLNPNRSSTSTAPKTPLKAAFPSTPAGPSTAFVSPVKKVLGTTPRRSTSSPAQKKTFVTPFKPGMRPGELGRARLEPSQSGSSFVGSAALTEILGTSGKRDKGKGRAVYFDLSMHLRWFTQVNH